MAPAHQTGDSAIKVLATNRKARHDYHILEAVEAGIELRGAEVKSIRDGRFSLAEAFAQVRKGEVFLLGLHIQPYQHARAAELDPLRPKRLLLHRREIDRVLGQAAVQGQALVPLRLYLRRGMVKVEIGVARGRQAADKRERIRRKTAAREAERAIAARTKRRR